MTIKRLAGNNVCHIHHVKATIDLGIYRLLPLLCPIAHLHRARPTSFEMAPAGHGSPDSAQVIEHLEKPGLEVDFW